PEGGFDDVEERLLDAAGAVPVGLGGRVLRLETAVVAALVRLVDVSPT
ncbi:MAG TPA: 16S rRNA (uracil(1498)-N(3))-methyltransferase, partial [Thermoanaerobaculia bacterium]|nr:16S rRNA (uracil(1498)-N(3))-methyltransferase [Thermoanaerobaculia bacterium]